MENYERYVGAVFDNRYRIEKIIGVGGMAVVFKAEDILISRSVAVKILKEEIARDEQSVKRFINESKAVSMLSHPNIVNIYDVSVKGELKYIVMEYIEGITLKTYMTRKGVLTLREIIGYVEQILRALEHAHSKGIVHRDIKPQNIMLLKNGIVKVTDFGIAKLPNAETVTMTDKAIGTVFYISPEQASGNAIDQRSDIYSLGVLMYEMATGKLPFTADSPVTVALMQINEFACPPKEVNPDIPFGLGQIIEAAMEKEPDDRYQNASIMLRQLMKLKENPDIVFKNTAAGKKGERRFISKSMLPIILGVFSAFIIVLGISGVILLNKLVINPKDSTETITVASFEGAVMTDELRAWFDSSNQYELVLIEDYSTSVKAGSIISQEPSAGETRRIDVSKNKKCQLTLTVSLGPKTVEMIDVIAMEYREAREILRDLGLNVKDERQPSDAYALSHVISTFPEKGTVLNSGDTVTLYVSAGPDGIKVDVPNYVGKTEEEALKDILRLGLYVGNISYEKSSETAGKVIYQSVSAGSSVYLNSYIDLKISGGPKYGEVQTDEPTDTDEPPEPTDTDSSSEPISDSKDSNSEPGTDTESGEESSGKPEPGTDTESGSSPNTDDTEGKT